MRKTFLTLLCVSSAIAHAADEDITFHGTLLSPPTCSISGGKTIEVEFRDLIIDDINGNYGRKEVPYELTCDSTTRHPDWEMTLTWTVHKPVLMMQQLKLMYPVLVSSFSTMVSVLNSILRMLSTPLILRKSRSWRPYR